MYVAMLVNISKVLQNLPTIQINIYYNTVKYNAIYLSAKVPFHVIEIVLTSR